MKPGQPQEQRFASKGEGHASASMQFLMLDDAPASAAEARAGAAWEMTLQTDRWTDLRPILTCCIRTVVQGPICDNYNNPLR